MTILAVSCAKPVLCYAQKGALCVDHTLPRLLEEPADRSAWKMRLSLQSALAA